jgi:hypothetical protein
MTARLVGDPAAPRSSTELYFSNFDMTTLPMPADMAMA